MVEQIPHQPPVPSPVGIPKINHRQQTSNASTHIYDTICIGFSTVGLGLAVALSDLTLDTLENTLFIERSSHFTPSKTTTQKTFAQDLATLRCPTSPYTFLNYLSESQRLESFLTSSDSLSPSNEEFEKYLHWAAEQFSDIVSYGEEVVNVEVVSKKGWEGKLWVVSARNIETGESRMLVCKNVVFATGSEARVARANTVPVMEQMRDERRSNDEVFSTLAVRSGRLAASLLFGSVGTTSRATL